MIRISNTPSRKRDQNVVLPRDVKTTIKRGRAAYSNANRGKASRPKQSESPRFIISIIDMENHRRREKLRKISKRRAKGRRGQPPKADRLYAVAIYVDQLERQNVRFGTCRSSRMNKEVRKWLNGRMALAQGQRKRPNDRMTEDGVRALLKQVQELREVR